MTAAVIGTALPAQEILTTTTMIVGAALASRDFEGVHHDRDAAQASGMADVFINILATNGLVVRYVTDWAGVDAVVERSSIRLGVPHFAGETLTLSGEITAADEDGTVEISVRGRNVRGDHVSGSVRVNLPQDPT